MGSGRGGFCFRLTLVGTCLLFVYVICINNLKSDPLSETEYSSIKHLYRHSFDPPYDNITDTVASVSKKSGQHGPLYFALLNVWSRLAGEDSFTLRLFSVYCGLFTLAAVYRLASLTGDSRLAINAALITAFMSYFIFYAHEIRMYSLLPFCAGWIAWSYWMALASRGRVRWWKWLSLFISAALILYVHYFGIFILAAVGIYHLLCAPKDRRWFQICLVMTAGGLVFLAWLPVAVNGFANRISLESDRLTWFESIRAIISIYSNRLWFMPIASAGLILWNFKRLTKPQKYLLILTCLTVSITILVNEFTPILVEFRMRYTTLYTALLACSFAISLTFIPKRKVIQIPLLLIWMASFFAFTDSSELFVYTNRQRHEHDKVPHYQKLSYLTPAAPGYGETVLSFHPTFQIHWKPIVYYSGLSDWRALIHISYNEQNEIVIQRSSPEFVDLDSIASVNNAIWLIYNPQQTDLRMLAVYTEWFSQHYQSCKRFLDDDDAIADYYVRVSIPCELINAETPFEVRYDNGNRLSNLLYEVDSDRMMIYFWWLNIPENDGVYAFSIQVFSEQGEKAQQYDNVIGLGRLAVHEIDISMLSEGNYAAKLIVYDFATGAGQPGMAISEQRRFEREIEIAQFAIGG